LQHGQVEEALLAFRSAAQGNPADVELLNNLGYALLLHGEREAAERWLLHTLTFAPGRANAWANLGRTYAELGKAQEATACFAQTYRFSRNPTKTREFLHALAADNNAQIAEAARRTLQFALVQPHQ
jgi:Flp pilus assembly protein TadD